MKIFDNNQRFYSDELKAHCTSFHRLKITKTTFDFDDLHHGRLITRISKNGRHEPALTGDHAETQISISFHVGNTAATYLCPKITQTQMSDELKIKPWGDRRHGKQSDFSTKTKIK